MGTQLSLLGEGAFTTPRASQIFTSAAWRLLTASATGTEAMRAISSEPAVIAECREHVAILEAAAAPCGNDAVRIALQPLAVTFGVPWEGVEVNGMALTVYFEALADLPLEAIRLGFTDCIRDKDTRHFPRPGPLRHWCMRHADRLRVAAYRARKAAELEAGPARPVQTAEEREEIKRQLAELGRQLATSAREKAAQPPGKRWEGRAAAADAIRRHADALDAGGAVAEAAPDFV